MLANLPSLSKFFVQSFTSCLHLSAFAAVIQACKFSLTGTNEDSGLMIVLYFASLLRGTY